MFQPPQFSLLKVNPNKRNKGRQHSTVIHQSGPSHAKCADVPPDCLLETCIALTVLKKICCTNAKLFISRMLTSLSSTLQGSEHYHRKLVPNTISTDLSVLLECIIILQLMIIKAPHSSHIANLPSGSRMATGAAIRVGGSL